MSVGKYGPKKLMDRDKKCAQQMPIADEEFWYPKDYGDPTGKRYNKTEECISEQIWKKMLVTV